MGAAIAAQTRAPRSLAVAAIPNPKMRDIAIMVAVLAAEVGAVLFNRWPGSTRQFDLGAGLLIGVSVTALWWRRSHPIAVTLLVTGAAVVWVVVQYEGGSHLAVLVGVFAIGLHEPSRRWGQGTALLVATLGAVHIWLEVAPDGTLSVERFLAGFTVPAIVWFAADRIRSRDEYLNLLLDRAKRSKRESQAAAEQAVADERARIARELHDVVAHRVSMMTVQAHAARVVVASDPQRAELSMRSVTAAGKQAMSELRRLLDVLRPESGAQPEAPQPGLDDIDALVDAIASTGLTVSYEVMGHPQSLPTAVGLSVYRIVQEALTNSLKHAGPTASVDVTLQGFTDEIVVTVVDDGHGAATDRDAAQDGHGIIGMKERVALFGGKLQAGPEDGGGFRVEATIPTRDYRR